jgi:hypothetical protein
MTPLNKLFTATIQKSDAPGGWTYVVWPESVEFFGTKGLVKVEGTMDEHEFRSSFMAIGDGRHKLPVTLAMLKVLGKAPGDSIAVHLNQRF